MTMSSTSTFYYGPTFSLQHQHTPDEHTPQLSSQQPYLGPDGLPLYDSKLINDTIAYIAVQQQRHLKQAHPNAPRYCLNAPQQPIFATTPPVTAVEQGNTTSLPLATHEGRQDSAIAGFAPTAYDWQQQQQQQQQQTSQMSMGGPNATPRPLKRARTHQRTPSASTINSNGPASPYTANFSYPHIANADFAPNSPVYYADQASIGAKNHQQSDSLFSAAGYIPSQGAHMPNNAHWAMKDFAINHHTADDITPDFYQSSRHSMSSHGNNSPATPSSGHSEIADSKPPNGNDFGKQPNPNIQLFRTESSQAAENELYNPPVTFTSTPAPTKRQTDFLSPGRNLISERLQTANLARSASPASAISRERSPFRDGSPLAPTGDWHAAAQHQQAMNTVSKMRQQQKQEAEQAEIAAHMPSLQREPTKTISPKEAMLDFQEANNSPLFQDTIPAGYRQHTGGTETWQNNFAGSTFGSLAATAPTQQPQMATFRATSADNDFSANQFNFQPLPPVSQDQGQISSSNFPAQHYAAPKMPFTDSNPEFPAHLTSMESSVSENGPPASSQDSFNNTSVPQRPLDTRANTGTYTCTYHGCTQRFESHQALQRHKRDFHRSQHPPQYKDSTPTKGTDGSTSPQSSVSPAPSGSGLTSAALQARNSQAGPHKCTRINPSTNKPCNTIFSRPYDLTRHEDTIHNNRKQKVRCPMCREEKTFSRNDALTRHMRVVHPEVESLGKRARRD